MTQLWSNTCKK